MVSFTPGPLYLLEKSFVPLVYEAWWASEQVWTLWRREKFLTFTGDRTPAV
jgi:hypothetical protein